MANSDIKEWVRTLVDAVINSGYFQAKSDGEAQKILKKVLDDKRKSLSKTAA